MTGTLRTLALITTLAIFAVGQESRVSPAVTAQENAPAVSTPADTHPATARSPSSPPFCPPKTCLYYAGDFDSTDSDANGLFNGNDTGEGAGGSTWVGVKPSRTATVTGATFNQLFTTPFVGTNPTPFQTQIGITEGNAGKLVCNTNGNATMKRYGESDFGLMQYSYTVKKLKQACTVQAGSKGATYVNLLPTSSTGYGYLANVEDLRPKNHRGWKNDRDDCFFCGDPECLWQNCDSQGIGNHGFSELSIALTGRKGK